MSSKVAERPRGITVSSPWPFERMPEIQTPKRKPTGWVMAISLEPELNGPYTYYPAGTGRQVLHIDNGDWNGKRITTRPFYRVDTKEQAEEFTVFCSRGYTPNIRLLPHQDGEFWGFNWCSLTASTVAIASQIAEHFFNGRRDAAWRLGHDFEAKIHAAENAAYAAAGK
jgi:hypothetical protein